MSVGTRRSAVVVVAVLVAATAVTAPTLSQAAPAPTPSTKVDRSLGNGLGRLLAQGAGASRRTAGGFRVDQDALTMRDGQGRVLVDLTPQAGVDRRAFRRAAEAAGLRVQSVGGPAGTLEGFVALDAVRSLQAVPGFGTLAQAVKPRANVGAATSQGVAFQRIDQVQKRGLDGKGVTIAALSDSYDTATTTVDGDPLKIHAAQDIASGDLPGPANPTYKTPVAVLDDTGEGGEDEGRAMLQIAHDIAPAAKLCFATAFAGLIGFADNVRRLADPADKCGADVIADDVFYADEPMFSDSVLSDAIDDVASRGVHYFTSAQNFGADQAWDSRVHLVSAAQARKTSNIDLSGVDPSLYDGGFEDLQQGGGIDVAQNVSVGDDGVLFDTQWNDPVDLDGAELGDPYFTGTGVVSDATPNPSFKFTPTADQLGQLVQFRTDAVPSGTTDLILSVTAPDGTDLGTIDTGSSPEVLATRLSQAGTYTITVSGYDGATGDFTVDVRPVLRPSSVTTDFNLLFFAPDGSFLADAGDENTLTGRPSELIDIAGVPEVQVVIARHGTGAVGATRLRTVLVGDGQFTEHVDPTDPATIGHPTARGATGVAAYDAFRPYLPEYFTSPGGKQKIYFDSAGRRLPKSQQTRVTPQIASTDGGNTTFFVDDVPLDFDLQPNFFGTSAAAPHAAGIAALAVQRARDQDRSLTPAELRRRMERSTFAHDLDPSHSGGKVSGVRLDANGPQSRETDTAPLAMTDPSFFTLRNTSGKTVRSVTLDGSTASPTALGAQASSRSSGIVFDPRPYDPRKSRLEVGFPFTVGGTSGGLKASTVSASYARPNGSGQFQTMTLTFGKGLKRGQTLRFGIDRDLAVSYYAADPTKGSDEQPAANEGNGADELGGAVAIPSGEKDRSGLTFTVTSTKGKSSSAELRNKLGSGFSPVDGYGLVNAEEAVLGH